LEIHFLSYFSDKAIAMPTVSVLQRKLPTQPCWHRIHAWRSTTPGEIGKYESSLVAIGRQSPHWDRTSR
jgi:hypothetical protein